MTLSDVCEALRKMDRFSAQHVTCSGCCYQDFEATSLSNLQNAACEAACRFKTDITYVDAVQTWVKWDSIGVRIGLAHLTANQARKAIKRLDQQKTIALKGPKE